MRNPSQFGERLANSYGSIIECGPNQPSVTRAICNKAQRRASADAARFLKHDLPLEASLATTHQKFSAGCCLDDDRDCGCCCVGSVWLATIVGADAEWRCYTH